MKAVSVKKVDAALFSAGIASYALTSGKFPDLQIMQSYKPTFARPAYMRFRKDARPNLDKTKFSLRNILSKNNIYQIRNKSLFD